jgi:HSP20 family protein
MVQAKTALESKEQTIPVSTEIEESIFEQFKETVQSIAHRAFELFEKRGRQFGYEVEDWLRAESEFFKRVPLEVRDADGNLEIRAEVPGFKPDELKVYVEPHKLTISGETELKTENKDENTLYSEWRAQKIFRSFDLPLEVKTADAKATLKDGVLMLTMPKAEAAEPLELEIETAK